jgi:tetratricopeptide (TPR) repeat protein
MNLMEDVLALIEAGKTDKALANVQKALDKTPDDLDAKRAAATVYYQKMVGEHEGNNSDGAIEWYGKYYALELPEDDKLHEKFKEFQRRIHPEFPRMQEANKLSKSGKNLEALAIYEEVLTTIKDLKVAYVNVGWCLYRLLAELAPQPEPDIALVNKCFNIYKRFEILGPSNLHAQMLRIALYFKDVEGVDLLDFLHGWNFSNFRDEDYEPFKPNPNSVIPSLCERAYLTYSRVLLGSLRNSDEAVVEKAKDYANEFLPQLEDALEKLPRNTWLPYARTLLVSQMGKTARVQMELIHLLKVQNNQFWAWASLAETFAQEGRDGDALACYCKAFLLPASGELGTHVREAFAKLLLKMNLKPEARFEIEQILRIRKKKVGKAAEQSEIWENEEWFKMNRPQGDNKRMLYTRHAGRADQLLWADLPDSIAVVTHVDAVRGVFFYAVDKRIGGKHNLKGIFTKVRVGDILAIKIREAESEEGGPKVWKVMGGKPERERIPKDICQVLNETIQIPYGRDFGFMKPSNIYVGADLVKNFRLYDGQKIKGLALLSYNKAKAEWGWKMIAVMGED